MSSGITYAGSAKRKRARLSATTAQDIGHEPRSLKKQRVAAEFDDEEVCDSELVSSVPSRFSLKLSFTLLEERETSMSDHRDSLLYSSSATQVGQQEEVEHSLDRTSREGTPQRSGTSGFRPLLR